ncbi:hypothetical protein niasHS_007172 [Heterodera schachtii]|uniref:PHD-type domain-containing protein n=1 Tax=Heterodera schachtii TaxID=97005 RepID=A0ABD2JL73_HETSC
MSDSKIVKSVTLLGAPGPSQETPLEPHWSRFDEEPRDLDRMVNVVLTVDPSVMPRDEFLDTPPYTTDSPRNEGGGGGYYQSLAENNNTNQQQQKLYYHAGLTPQAKFLGEQQQHSSGAAVSASVVQTATTSGANSTTTVTAATVTIDGGAAVAQREYLIKTSELPALLMIQQSMEKKRVAQALHDGGFKWRGFGWNIWDTTLVQSFRRQYDGTKQQFAAVHLQTNEKRMNWSEDSRQCSFCEQIGDGDQRLTGRLLNVDANKWVHVNCALWSAEVHVAEDGGLINVEAALRRAKVTECRLCGLKGASIRCYKLDCANNELAFHLICAKHSHGHFVKDKTLLCRT